MDQSERNSLKKQLESQRLEVDRDEMLTDIFSELPEPKKKRVIFWWWTLGLASAVGIYGMALGVVADDRPEQLGNPIVTYQEQSQNEYCDTTTYALKEKESNSPNQKATTSLPLTLIDDKKESLVSDHNTQLESTEQESNVHTAVNLESPSIVESNARELSTIEFVSLRHIANLEIEPLIMPSITPNNQGKKRRKKKRPSKWVIDMNVGTFLYEPKQANMNGLISMDSDLLIGKSFGNITLVTGMHLAQRNVKFDHTATTISPIRDYSTAQVHCPDDILYCQNFSALATHTQRIRYNYIRQVSIPAGLIYSTGKRTSVRGSAMLYIPIVNDAKWHYANDTEYKAYDNSTDESYFSPRWSINAGIMHPLSKRVSTYAQLGYNSTLFSDKVATQYIGNNNFRMKIGLSINIPAKK